jgi:hypothetical protein
MPPRRKQEEIVVSSSDDEGKVQKKKKTPVKKPKKIKFQFEEDFEDQNLETLDQFMRGQNPNSDFQASKEGLVRLFVANLQRFLRHPENGALEWIDDIGIYCAMQGLVQEGGRPGVTFIDPQLQWNKPSDLEKIKNVVDQTPEMICFPLSNKKENDFGSHWSMGVMDLTKKKLYYFDSLNPFSETGTKFFENAFKHLKLSISWKRVVCESMPRQQNASDCGIFVLAIFKALSHPPKRGHLFQEVTQQNMDKLRMKFLHTIMKLYSM